MKYLIPSKCIPFGAETTQGKKKRMKRMKRMKRVKQKREEERTREKLPLDQKIGP
jgi:hypothetical protein